MLSKLNKDAFSQGEPVVDCGPLNATSSVPQ